jgi:hypothetical protein
MLILRVIESLRLGNATMAGFRLHGSLSMKKFRIDRLSVPEDTCAAAISKGEIA